MNVQFSALLAEGEVAQIKLERAMHVQENAKLSLELARSTLEASKLETSKAFQERSDVLLKADEAGLSSKAFRTLIEDRVTALVNSGFFSHEIELSVNTPVIVVRTRRAKSKEGAEDSPAVVVEHTPVEHTVVALDSVGFNEVESYVHQDPVHQEPESAKVVDSVSVVEPVEHAKAVKVVQSSIQTNSPPRPSFLRN